MHSVIVELNCQPGKRDDVFQAWHDHLSTADSANPDIVQLTVVLDDADGDAMRLVEFYSDSAGFDRVSESTEVGSFIEAAMPLLASPPNIVRSTPTWSKGLDLDAD